MVLEEKLGWLSKEKLVEECGGREPVCRGRREREGEQPVAQN